MEFYETLIGIGLLCLFVIFIVALFSKKRKSYLFDANLYKTIPIMNRSEKIFFTLFTQTFPQYYIFPQIPFSCIVTPKFKEDGKNKPLLWKINQKRVDFLICDTQLNNLFIVEIDGPTHTKTRGQDNQRDDFFAEKNIPTLRIPVTQLTKLTRQNLKNMVEDILD